MNTEDTLFHAEYLTWTACALIMLIMIGLGEHLTWWALILGGTTAILAARAARHLHELRKDIYG